jgi:D-alanine-D-alanine ligase
MLDAVFSSEGPPGALKICVLSDEDYYPWTPAPYLQNYHWELYYLNKMDSARVVQELVKRDYDIFLNMCDSSWNEPYPGPEVIHVLEHARAAFTGADSAFYDPSREDMKRVCRLYGLHTPQCIEVLREEDIEQAAATLPFPLFVKIPNSFGSTGIEPDSRVETPAALFAQARKLLSLYGGALIEQFVEGREFTVLVVENPDDMYAPKIYHPLEFLFPPGVTFKHFNLKWNDWESMGAKPCDDPVLAERLMEAGRKLFVGLNGVGYGRCDMRLNAAGEIHILEINPNCGVLYAPEEPGSADLVLMNDPEGQRGFVERIFRAALARRDRLLPNWFVRYYPESGYGLYAKRAIAAGEVILHYEKRSHTLISLRQVERNWPTEQQQVFARHAYPLTDEIYVLPSINPAEWTPINHSCEPNAWWQGLNIVARRPIPECEQITLDYATFHNERMSEFACICESPTCRKIVRGTDYVQPFVERYEGHLTEFVRQKRFTADQAG